MSLMTVKKTKILKEDSCWNHCKQKFSNNVRDNIVELEILLSKHN